VATVEGKSFLDLEQAMNILALVGSFRKKGNTARIVQMIGAELETLAERTGQPLIFETLYLGDQDIRPCRGCRTCFDRGEEKCPLRDNMPDIRAKMAVADGLLLAGPVYMDDVSGLVKNWIDRQAYLCHRPGFGGKCAYAVATVGGSPTRHALRTMNGALLTWGYHLVGQTGLKMGALAPAEEMARYRPDAARAAARLFDAISHQDALRPAFRSLMTFKIQQMAWQRQPPDSYDVAYWREQGWLEPDRTFYVAHRARRFKVGLARLAGAAIAPFVI
jgi:multimeric flavodoxin WrbA